MKHPFLLASLAAAMACHAAVPEVSLRVLPERDLVYSSGSSDVVVQIEIEARKPETGRRAPMNLALVLDRSGSMQGAKIEKARQAACLALDRLADDDFFSLVTFDDQTDLLIPPARVGDTTRRERLKEKIDRIRPGGSTAIHAGVSLGAAQVRKHLDQERVNRIILLSDGIANVGPSRTSDLAALGRELRSEGLSVTTIGLGDDYNEDLMTALAEASNANYYYVRDAEKLPGIFAEELGLARSLAARRIEVRISAPEGVRLKEIIGRPEIDCRDGRAAIQLPELFGGEMRRYLARCEFAAKAGEPAKVATVDLEYETTDGTRGPAQNASAEVRGTDAREKAESSLRGDVARELSVARNRLAKEKAVKLADEGRTKDAAAVLRQQAIENAAAPAPAKLPGVQEENRKLEEAASEISGGAPLSATRRKSIQWENYQDKYQKR